MADAPDNGWLEASALVKKAMILMGIQPVTQGTVSFDFHQGSVILVKPQPHIRAPRRDPLARHG